MPATVGGGIASGITNAMTLGLRAEGNEIRRERTEALERASGNRLALDLEKFNLAEREFEAGKPKAQLDFEAVQQQNKLREIELQKLGEEEKKKDNWLTVQGHMESRYGKNFTPTMIEKYRSFLDFMLVDKARDGIYNEFDVDQALASAFDTENPNIGGAEKLRDYFNAGMIQSDNQIEAREQEFGKIVEKNPILGRNPEALQGDPKAAELSQSIGELKQASNQFRSLGAEVDDFVIRQKEEKKRQRALKRERIQSQVSAIQGNIDRAKAKASGKALNLGTSFNRVAQELYPGRTPNSLNDTETKAVNDKIQELTESFLEKELRLRGITFGGGSGRVTEESPPLSPFDDPLQNPIGLTEEEVRGD